LPTTSEPSAAGVRRHVQVYLDAKLLVAGFVRTLLLLSGLFLAHRDRFGVDPTIQAANPARLRFRGVRCVLCTTAVTESGGLLDGQCPSCLKHAGC
jgi:hypothetical protein